MNMDINQLLKVNKLTLAVSLLSIAVILATYWPMLVPLHLRWAAFDEAYSHGYMVAAMAGYSIVGQLLKNQAESQFSYSALLLALLVSPNMNNQPISLMLVCLKVIFLIIRQLSKIYLIQNIPPLEFYPSYLLMFP